MVVLAAGLAALVLAACGGDDDDGGGGNATAATPSTGVVSKQTVDGTRVLVDSDGKTLYSADVEKGGRIHCTGACLSFWDPVTASASNADSASMDLGLKLGVVKRPDGGDQLTLGGKPLYSFSEEGPGKLEGDGFVDDFEGTHFEWSAATTGAGSGSSGSGSSSGGSPYSGNSPY